MMFEWETEEYLAARRRSYERIRGRHPTLVTRGFDCYAGWHPILADFFDEVERLMSSHPGSEFSLFQVKEKFGGLRVYTGGLSPEIAAGVADAIRVAEDLALQTCDVCGRPGSMRVDRGAYATRCDEHAGGAVQFERKEG